MRPRLPSVHSWLITLAILVFIWGMNLVRLNLHYLDPFNNGIKDYEISDIVYSQLFDPVRYQEDRIVIINPGNPDRQRIAKLVDRLIAADAAVIGLDIYFDGQKDPVADSTLQATLKNTDRVVLACTLQDSDLTDDRVEGYGGVDTMFSNYAPIGYGNFPSNSTKTIRIFSPREPIGNDTIPAFSSALLKKYAPERYATLLDRGGPVEDIYYSGHLDAFIHMDIDYVLGALSAEQLRQSCQGRIILVGYSPTDKWANQLVDRHYSPLNKSYDAKAAPDIFGVVIHANVISMVLDGRYVRRLPKWTTHLLALLLCLGNVVLFRWIYHRFNQSFHGITRGIQLTEFLLIFLVTAMLFYFFRLRLELTVAILAVLLAYDFIMIYESLVRPRVPWLREAAAEGTEPPDSVRKAPLAELPVAVTTTPPPPEEE